MKIIIIPLTEGSVLTRINENPEMNNFEFKRYQKLLSNRHAKKLAIEIRKNQKINKGALSE